VCWNGRKKMLIQMKRELSHEFLADEKITKRKQNFMLYEIFKVARLLMFQLNNADSSQDYIELT
jgi:hypothetical protein